ncbi:MAG: hypothetical protein HOP23_03245 [Methylococcaceae bacterium]|nr:hypothetical protein [Methylococcaceae bacterium]
MGSWFYYQDILLAQHKRQQMIAEFTQIQALQACHSANADKTYLFMPDTVDLAPKYGALTGMKSAFIPHNFSGMSAMEKNAYFKQMVPFVAINNLKEKGKCPS